MLAGGARAIVGWIQRSCWIDPTGAGGADGEPVRLPPVSCGVLADFDGEAINAAVDASPDCGTLLATCARKSTGANPIVAALASAALDWLMAADVERLRSTLLGVVAGLA
jgi:hypothetical protein